MSFSLTKTNAILGVLFVVQVILLVTTGGSDAATGAGAKKAEAVAGTKPFSAIKAADVRSLVITTGDGKSISVAGEEVKEGDKTTMKWTLADRDGYPAKGTEIDHIVESLNKATLTRSITNQEKRYAGLKVADAAFDIHVVAKGAEGKVLADFFVGETKDYNAASLRKVGDASVYRTVGLSKYDLPVDPSQFVDTAFMSVPVESVVRVRLQHDGKTFEIAKEAPASKPASQPTSQPVESQPASKPAEPVWMTVGDKPEMLDKSKVESWIRGIATLAMSEPVGKAQKPEHGFDKPTAVVMLGTADGKQTTVTVGAERKDPGDYFVTATGKDHVVTVRAYNVTDWSKKESKDLLPGKPGAPPDMPEDH